MNIIYIFKIFNFTKKYLKTQKSSIITFIILTLINYFITLYIPLINSTIIDSIVNKVFDNLIWTSVKIILILSIINILFSYFLGIINTKLSSKLTYSINYDVLNNIKSLPIFFFHENSSSYINQRLNNDSNTLSNFIINGLKDIIMNFIMICFSFYILFNLNSKITLILLFLLPIYIILYIIYKEKLYNLNYKYRESQNVFFSDINSQLDNIKLIKINVLFDIINRNLNSSFNNLFKIMIKSTKSNILFSNIGVLISVISNTVIMYLGITEIIAGNLTIGQFTILSLYFSNIMNSIKYFLSYSAEFQNVKVSYNRIIEWITLPQEHNSDLIINSIDEIKIENLNFKYNDNYIYKDFNLSITKGNIYQLKGTNGSGKSTLINIIIGLYTNYYEGSLKFNNISMSELNMYSIRTNLIGVTEQEPLLLKDTILNNITYNLNNINSLTLKKYIEILNLDSFLNELPNGINTQLANNNYNISGGEKQKISLLRTLIKNPDLIILDESTSSLDVSTTNNIKNLIESIKKDKIIIIVDHNDNFTDIVDFIIDVDNIDVEIFS